MTVDANLNRMEYDGDGATTVFAFPIYFLADEDLAVVSRNAAGAESRALLNVDYTVTGAGNPEGGAVTMISAPAAGDKLVVYRDPPLTQLTDYRANDAFPAETHEAALDKLTMQMQRVSERIDRSVTLEETATSGEGAYDFGGNRISNVGDPIDIDDAATRGYLDQQLSSLNGQPDGTAAYVGDFAGTADALEAYRADAPAAPVDGFPVIGRAVADSTGAVTLKFGRGAASNWGPKKVRNADDTALSAGEFVTGGAYVLRYNAELDAGAGAFQVFHGSAGGAITQPVYDTFSGDGATTAFTLSTTPGSTDNLVVFMEGVFQPDTEWSLVANTLTFTAAPPAGTNNIGVFIMGQAGSTVTPADGSVTAPKLASNAVETAKIGNGAVTPVKRTGEFFIAREQYSSATGVSLTSGDNTRTLNTEIHNDFGATLASNQISGLPAGRYRVSGFSSKYAGSAAHQVFLYNVTDSVIQTEVVGHAGYSGGSTGADNVAIPFCGVIDIAAGKSFELRQWAGSTVANNGGWLSAQRAGLDAVYSEIMFERISG